MAEARSTDQTVDFIEGKEVIQPWSISPSAWTKIIRNAIGELLLKHGRGFRPLSQILAHEPRSYLDGVRLEVGDPRKWLGVPNAYERTNRVFFVCTGRSDFPRSWKEAPQIEGPHPRYSCPVRELGRLKCEHLLLDRKGCFHLMQTEWVPHEEWDPNSMSSSPQDFWYTLETSSSKKFAVEELADKVLEAWFRPIKEGRQPEQMSVLYELYVAAGEVANDMHHNYEWALDVQTKVARRLARMGMPVD